MIAPEYLADLYETESAKSEHHHRWLLENYIIMGLYDDDNTTLVGISGAMRSMKPRLDHKATSWGTYVCRPRLLKMQPPERSPGSKLLLAISDHLRTLGVRILYGSVVVSNLFAIKTVTDAGFIETAFEPAGMKTAAGDGFHDIQHFVKFL